MPFGPEVSWPYGFRPLDAQSREILESAYGTGPVYLPPALEDYGDPGYSDPAYEGPRTSYSGPSSPAHYGGPASHGQHGGSASHGRHGRSAPPGQPGSSAPPGQPGGSRNAGAPRSGYRPPDGAPPGYHVPGSSRPSHPNPDRPDIWPVTGAQDALRNTGAQPVADARGVRGSDGSPQAGTAAYPEQWYDNPRLDDRVIDDASPSRTAGTRGITYGEPRYDEPPLGELGYAERLDDESSHEDPRRGAPAYPRRPGDPQGPGDPRGPSGPRRPVKGRAFGQRTGSGFPPGPDRAAGYGQPRSGRDGAQMSAGRMTGSGIRSVSQPGSSPRSSSLQSQSAQSQSAQSQSAQSQTAQSRSPGARAAEGTGFLSAPVGLLTPPTGTRVDALRGGGALPADSAARTEATQVLAAPGDRVGTAAVRPGRGLDGPEITSSWPVQPAAGDLDSFGDVWREDEDEEYLGLFADGEAEFGGAEARQAVANRRIGRRRGRSNDHRLWLGLGGVVVVAAAAIVGIVKFEFPSHSGPAHTMETPTKIGTYTRTVDLEHQADVAALRENVVSMSSGKASQVRSAVYESGNSAAGNTEQIIMFIGGHLANADPAASIASFTQQFKGAKVVRAGSLGGEAACVQDGNGSNGVAMCAWFDNDSFGEIVSPTMNAAALAKAMQTIRPSVELVATN